MAKAALKPKPPELVIHDCEQGTPEWFEARRGKVTASELSKIMADSDDKLGRTKLLRQLAGEVITEEPRKEYTNAYMEAGKEREAEARDWYARKKITSVDRAGFIYNPAIVAGWSPDGLVGKDGAVEIKIAEPHIIIGLLEKGTFPNEHRAQCVGGALLIGRRRWVDLVVYSHPKLPVYIARLEPDPAYMTEVSDAIEVFNWDLKKLVERTRARMR